MANDADRDLRRLIKRYRIEFKGAVSPSQWPSAHKSTFENIRKIGAQRYDGFCASIDIHSNEQPWREQTKHRAEYLAKRATHLFNQQRNEAGWRFGLENDVLKRFTFEVACPKCRARLWRSEIEASVVTNGLAANFLDERQRSRKPCQCSPEDRPRDYYEMGTNPLFDDRTQEFFLHDPLLRSELPRQGPDRVYGLQLTKNFENLLSEPMAIPADNRDSSVLGDNIRISPFKEGIEPLLFPFLILEAKSESSSQGFDAIQTQTAFPIWALLKLQEDLQAQVVETELRTSPLVWFFANRGDAWRLFGCYLTENETDKTKRYEIVHLWDGCIMVQDDALQLLLIVDYIFDWARDVYRPSLLKQLRSIVTGETCDQISQVSDSDIFSMRRKVSDWVQAAPSTIYGLEADENFTDPSIELDHPAPLTMPIPNTRLGTIRSASLVDSRLVGLYITEDNVVGLLQSAGGLAQDVTKSRKVARTMVNFLTQWDVLSLTGHDIDCIEQVWTGEVRARNAIQSTATFYTMIEFTTYMTPFWETVREITFLAVSEQAFGILVEYADFKIHHSGIEDFSKYVHTCSDVVLREALGCLRSGSAKQILIGAVTCTAIALYSLPERNRAETNLPTSKLGFGYLHQPRLGAFILKYHKLNQQITTGRSLMGATGLKKHSASGHLNRFQLHPRPNLQTTSVIRVSERRDAVRLEDNHDINLCERCRRRGFPSESRHHLPPGDEIAVSGYGVYVVESLNYHEWKTSSLDRHDICVFAVDMSKEINDDIGLSVVLEDIRQSGIIYHTIHHPLPPRYNGLKEGGDQESYIWRDTLWNLPLPYRPSTNMQQEDIFNWIRELRSPQVTSLLESRARQKTLWSDLQLLLHYLNDGRPYKVAIALVNQSCFPMQDRKSVYAAKNASLADKCEAARLNNLDLCRMDLIGFKTFPVKVPTKGSRLPLQWAEELADRRFKEKLAICGLNERDIVRARRHGWL